MDSDVYIQGLRSCIHSEYGGGGLEFVSGLPDRSRLSVPEACRVSQPEGRGVEDAGDEGADADGNARLWPGWEAVCTTGACRRCSDTGRWKRNHGPCSVRDRLP